MNIKLVKKKSNSISSASLSSMIDIIFLLIIFFVVSASFDSARTDSRVLLPLVDLQTNSRESPAEILQVNVLASGNVKVGFIEVSKNEVVTRLPKIIKAAAPNNELEAVISADSKTKHKDIAMVMEALALSGYSNAAFSAQIKE